MASGIESQPASSKGATELGRAIDNQGDGDVMLTVDLYIKAVAAGLRKDQTVQTEHMGYAYPFSRVGSTAQLHLTVQREHLRPGRIR